MRRTHGNGAMECFCTVTWLLARLLACSVFPGCFSGLLLQLIEQRNHQIFQRRQPGTFQKPSQKQLWFVCSYTAQISRLLRCMPACFCANQSCIATFAGWFSSATLLGAFGPNATLAGPLKAALTAGPAWAVGIPVRHELSAFLPLVLTLFS